jgi:hypothetical protein
MLPVRLSGRAQSACENPFRWGIRLIAFYIADQSFTAAVLLKHSSSSPARLQREWAFLTESHFDRCVLNGYDARFLTSAGAFSPQRTKPDS